VEVGTSRALYAPDPEYTAEARQSQVKGTVIVWGALRVDGCLRDLRIVRKLGYRLDESAMRAVSHWRFVPYLKNGVPTETEINIEVNFDPTFTPLGEMVGGEPCGLK
jgi:TonB family protein